MYDGKGYVDVEDGNIDNLKSNTILAVNDTLSNVFLALKLGPKSYICGEDVYTTRFKDQYVKISNKRTMQLEPVHKMDVKIHDGISMMMNYIGHDFRTKLLELDNRHIRSECLQNIDTAEVRLC